MDPLYALTPPLLLRAWDFYSDGGDFDKNGIRVFQEHYAHIRKLVPPERLLEYDVKDGWGPLCEFLGDPVPEIPFPDVNTSEQFIKGTTGSQKRALGLFFTRLLFFSGVTSVIGFAIYFSKASLPLGLSWQ